MDPHQLIGPASPLGSPAPFWFLEFFKVLGFTLHLVPMHVWYAGLLVVALLSVWGGPSGRRLRNRLLAAMPFVVAIGVNLGIVPLLFTQVAYYRVYYPAGILMAWPWFGVIVLLTLAYYGVYLAATSSRSGWRPGLGVIAGWVSAVLFVVIGFLFANNFSLMTNVAGWQEIFTRTAEAGAPTGLALNTGDVTLWPRWLMMFGLALTTTAVFIAVETAFAAGRETHEYRLWASRCAAALHTIGAIWFASMGSWYIFGALRPEVYASAMTARPVAVLFAATAVSPGLPWALLVLQRRGVTRPMAAAAAAAQFLVLALNAVSRQWVQNVELAPYLDAAGDPVRIQWSPLVIFLLLFVGGLAIVVWMLMKVVEANRQAARVSGR